jgi:hypothetical protein
MTIIMLACAPLCSGCALGGLWQTVFGPNKVPPKYVLPKTATLVLVENYRNPAISQLDADLVANQLNEELKHRDLAPLVDPDKLSAVRDVDAAKYHSMSILDVAKAVGAKQVIYVVLVESSVETDSSQSAVHGRVAAQVRVVDADSGLTLWPLDSAQGYPLSADIPYNRADPDRMATMHAQMLAQLSDAVAKLFYAWQPDSTKEAQDQ